ncbi:MAG TPA: non-homologous end-joining DNA ligase, partial [Chitinophagales bacterium]|nr:non-homologous end-joining DNA ligase [Chitinophagales bacterium]
SKELNGEYRMYPVKKEKKEWLLERVDKPQIDWLHDLIEPMLAETRNEAPEGEQYIYEVKWDGIRAFVVLDDGKLTIRSRSHRDITHIFPELNIPEKTFRATCGLFDTEIVCLESDGRPNFKTTVNRLMQSTPGGIERGSKKHPAHCYVFDCLYLDGRPIVNEPLTRRREWLKDALRISADLPFRVSESLDDGKALFEAAKKIKLEGIMAKVKDSRYLPGKRSSSWLKIKVRDTAECFIIGYTKGKGDREVLFGALHLGEYVNDELIYRGKVGTGFDSRMMKEVFSRLKEIKEIKRPVKEKLIDDHVTTWIEPKLICEIQYSSLTENGIYREPVFLRLREDLM